MQEKNVKFDYILCATMVMLCCRALLLEDALAVNDILTSSDLELTFQQRCYICNHIIACFLKIDIIKDRDILLERIFRMLPSIRDSNLKDSPKDSASDISVYLDMCHGLRQLEKVLKHPDSHLVALLQGCMSCLECRIPAGRSRVPSSSSVHSHHSSTSSSRATSPTPPVSTDAVPCRELLVAELFLCSAESSQRDSSELSIAHVPISETHATEKQSVQASNYPAATVAPPPYVFVPCSSLQPDSFKLLTREIGEVCEEYQIGDTERSARLELVKEIDRVVSKWNQAFRVAVYGSFATGLCDRDSDVDLLIATPAALTYMETHNFYEATSLPPPPLPPVMLDDLFILIQSDPALRKRHERPPR
jgi:hypothetical protein